LYWIANWNQSPEVSWLSTTTPSYAGWCRVFSEQRDIPYRQFKAADSVSNARCQESYDLVVLDVMLPEMDGFEVLRRIRVKSSTPILMLTARGDDLDRILGLEIGADDYLPKPFNTRELSARIRAILRRANSTNINVASSEAASMRVGDLELNAGARTVRCGGEALNLTTVEFDLLQRLLRSAGSVVGREELTKDVLGREFSPFDRSIDTHVWNLRRKVGNALDGGERIKSIRGIGYLYALPDRSGGE
jgi:DNA-binding response OmpR family regulator